MMIDSFQLIRNIGQFASYSGKQGLELNRFNLIYAENGRGKTTLAAILQSLNSADPKLINERRRLGSTDEPHLVINSNGISFIFQNGSWTKSLPEMMVFDDVFVSRNVCSGIDIASEHRQALHELILGSQGVQLNKRVKEYISKIEEHNRVLKIKEQAIPVDVREERMSVDDFCALEYDPKITDAIQEAERNLAAARSADSIQKAKPFLLIELPSFDLEAVEALLNRSISDIDRESATHVKEHISSLGEGGENWVNSGMKRIEGATSGRENEICPFCAQELHSSAIIDHYRVYFSQAYAILKQEIAVGINQIEKSHGGDVPAAFERRIRETVERKEFWKTFIDVPDVDVDTAKMSLDWKTVRDSILEILRSKQAAPLEIFQLNQETRAAVSLHEKNTKLISILSNKLSEANKNIELVKEKTIGASVTTLKADLKRLQARQARHSEKISPLCKDYLDEKEAKKATEALRDNARKELDEYRETIFPAYEQSINEYLKRFNAGFRIAQVASANTRGGSTCNYSVLINDNAVSLNADGGPSFRNTLSAGDRNTLALAFFFTSLEKDPDFSKKIVVIDDPMTSLDEHRSLHTRQEIRRLLNNVCQIIILSHSKSFLCLLWNDSDKNIRKAFRIQRQKGQGNSSELELWDINKDCVTEHDKRHEKVRVYLNQPDPNEERNVAASLRPILESFLRVAYPEEFPPEAKLGQFHQKCRDRLGAANEILSKEDTEEFRFLLDYANKYHHDTNPLYETECINDQELLDFCRRTLNFSRR